MPKNQDENALSREQFCEEVVALARRLNRSESVATSIVDPAIDLLLLTCITEQLRPLSEIPITEASEAAEEMEPVLGQAQRLSKDVPRMISVLQSQLGLRAEQLGMTWKQIGAAMGMSSQAAYKRAHPDMSRFEFVVGLK